MIPSDVSEFKSVFLQTATTIVHDLKKDLRILEKDPQNTTTIEESFRIVHKLKGEAALMGFYHMGFLAHVIEDIFYEIEAKKQDISHDLIAILKKSYTLIEDSLQLIKATKDSEELDTTILIQELKQFTGVKTEGVGRSRHT